MDRQGAPHTVMVNICLVAGIVVAYLLAPSLAWLYVAAALTGLSFAGIELSYTASILLYAEPGRAAQYQSIHSFLVGVRGILAPLIALPLMRHYGYTMAFIATLVLMSLGALCQHYATQKR